MTKPMFSIIAIIIISSITFIGSAIWRCAENGL